MTPRRLASLCFRLLSLAVLANLLAALPQTFQFSGMLLGSALSGGLGFSAALQISLLLAALAVQFGFVIWLWRKSGVAAAWLFGYDLQDDPDEPDVSDRTPGAPGLDATALTPAVTEAIAFSVLGAWMLSTAIPEVVRAVGSAILYADQVPPEFRTRMQAGTLGTTAALGARVALGFWLLFGAHGIVRMLRRLRGIGLEDPDRTG